MGQGVPSVPPSHYSARASYIDWYVDDSITDFLPAMNKISLLVK